MICNRLATKVLIGKLPAMGWVWVTVMVKGVMGKHNSFMTLIWVHSTMHLELMHPKVIICIHQRNVTHA